MYSKGGDTPNLYLYFREGAQAFKGGTTPGYLSVVLGVGNKWECMSAIIKDLFMVLPCWGAVHGTHWPFPGRTPGFLWVPMAHA